MTKIFLKRGKEESLGRRHPWVFSGASNGWRGSPPKAMWWMSIRGRGSSLPGAIIR